MNQCMGCQANWPTRINQFGGHVIHEVQGGYPGEIVGCTKERYEEVQVREIKKPDRRKIKRPGRRRVSDL